VLPIPCESILKLGTRAARLLAGGSRFRKSEVWSILHTMTP
jgi:hypothetical protein